MKCGVANKARNLKKHKKAKAKSALAKKAFLAEKAAAGADVEMSAGTDTAAPAAEGAAVVAEGSNKEQRAHGIKLKKQLKIKTKELKTQRLKLTKLPKGDAKQAKRSITTKLQALRKESLNVRAATGGDKKATKAAVETAAAPAVQDSMAE